MSPEVTTPVDEFEAQFAGLDEIINSEVEPEDIVEVFGMGTGDDVFMGDGPFDLDQWDFTLIALLCDPIYCAELLVADPTNMEYGGCYRVRDYQYPLNRIDSNYAGAACGRSVGKTESIKNRALTHPFKRHGENLLLTAPELIHLLPLTDSVEGRFMDIRLTREFLDTRMGKTGFTHRPFGVDFLDGTKIVGRIPRLTGTGVKGQHQPDLIIDEAQDYPERGWIEVHETVMKDRDDFTYHFYGVHSGARDSGFFKRINTGAFTLVQITGLMRPDWNASQKEAAKAAYGGSTSPDYRRNILGEPGSPATAFFVTARLVACVDQNRESDYNILGYVHQTLRSEEVDEMRMPIGEILDLPSNFSSLYLGEDIGLTNSPTEIVVFDHCKHEGVERMKVLRRYTLERFRSSDIRKTMYALALHFGSSLKSFGVDSTGLGFPIMQDVEDDEDTPAHLLDVLHGYFFNSKVPVGVNPENVVKDSRGNMKDQYGAAVKEDTDPLTGITRYVVYQMMIEASTRYLREWVDSGFLLLPWDTEITTDMQGETQQRVKAIAERARKPNAFHILDAMRAGAMGFKADEIADELERPKQQPVLDMVVDA